MQDLIGESLPFAFVEFEQVHDYLPSCPYYRLLWTGGGSLKTEMNGNAAVQIPHSSFLISGPGDTLRFPSGRTDIGSFAFRSSFFSSVSGLFRTPCVLPDCDFTRSIMIQIDHYRYGEWTVFRGRLSRLLVSLVGELLDRKEGPLSSLESLLAGDSRQNLNNRSVVYAIRYMQQNLNNPDLSLNEIAQAIGYHPRYFCREFGKVLNVSPMRFLNHLRVRSALELLEDTDDPVQWICRQVGIRNPSSLSSMIREKTGMTPVEYRRKIRMHRIASASGNTESSKHA